MFLFGPRGTGKSTLVQQEFSQLKTLWIDGIQELGID